MEKFGKGETQDRNYVDKRINTWVERWKSGDPFGGFAIRLKSGEFVGHVVLGHGDHPGHSEIAYLIRSDKWQLGYGSEAVRGVVQGLAPLLRVYGFKVEGAEFRVIDATASPDNDGSIAVLLKVGMAKIGSLGKFNTERILYQGQVALPDPTLSWESLVSSYRIITRDLK
jgi:RimJ/RimL family protein N-acetyltransferase